MKMKLNPEYIHSTSSIYINNPDQREKWNIDNLVIEDKSLDANISIQPNSSSTSFHLSFFSAMEFASQVQIIYKHHYAKLEKKTEEAWMIESSFESKKRIDEFQNIHLHMFVSRIRCINNYLYCWATHRISDNSEGLFLIKIKSVMKLPN
jgi:hypothetical protein